MTNLLIKSMSHKFLTPINSLTNLINFIKREISNQLIKNKGLDQAYESLITCEESTSILQQLIKNLNVKFI